MMYLLIGLIGGIILDQLVISKIEVKVIDFYNKIKAVFGGK